MKALVTGGNGFVGRRLVQQLVDQGHEVSVLIRRPDPELQTLCRHCFIGDLRDYLPIRQACKDQDVVFHTAAKAGIWGPFKEYETANVVGTEHVLQACREREVPHLIFTSSPSVTFDGTHARKKKVDGSYPEESKMYSAYSITKQRAEKLVLEAHDPNGLKTIALRPHLIWGPNDPHLLPRVLQRAQAGRLAQIGKGENMVDLSYIDNVCHAHLKAWECLLDSSAHKSHGRAYFISDQDPVMLWRWIEKFCTELGYPALKIRIPFPIAYGIGWLLEQSFSLFRLKKEPPLTRFSALQLATDHYYDNTQAQEELNYYPIVSPQEAWETTLASWQHRAR